MKSIETVIKIKYLKEIESIFSYLNFSVKNVLP